MTNPMTDYDEKSVVNDDPSYLEEEEIRALFDSMLLRLTSPIYVAAGGISGTGDDPWELTPEEMNIKLGDSSEIGIQDWGNTMTFSATDADTVEWSVGDITLTSGKIYNIDAGNTGTMSAITYIYLDVGTSETALQTSTTAADSVGSGKILVAVAEDNSDATSDATLQVFGGSGGILLAVDNIAANSASTNELISNTAQIKDAVITSAKIDSIAANKITVGTLTGFTIQTAATGYRVKLTSASSLQFLYNDTAKGSIGADTGDSIIYSSTDNHIFKGEEGAEVLKINEDGLILPSSHSIFFTGGVEIRDEGSNLYIDSALEMGGHVYPRLENTYDLGSGDKRWREGFFEDVEVDDLEVKVGITGAGGIDMVGDIRGEDIRCDGTFKSSDGSSGVTSSNFDLVTRVSTTKYYTHNFDFKDGLVTDTGSEDDHDL